MVQAAEGRVVPLIRSSLTSAIFVVYNELMKYRVLHSAFVWDVLQKPC